MPTQRSISQMRYDNRNTKRYALKFNSKTDADIISEIEKQPSFQAYIKRLIREDIAREAADNAVDK